MINQQQVSIKFRVMDVIKKQVDLDTSGGKRNVPQAITKPAFDFLVQIPQRLQNCLKTRFRQSDKYERINTPSSVLLKEKGERPSFQVNLEKQLQAWKENPSWVDHPPNIKVSVPKGSLCNLSVEFEVGLPPDAVFNIVIDPDNRRVFKNIKVRFKQAKTGFMKRFEGHWKVEPLFVDENLCSPLKPKTWEDYESCSGGKGRVGSVVSLDQLIQPALLPPPPLSWYLRGITTRTTEMLICDLLAETAKIRRGIPDAKYSGEQAHGFDPMHRSQIRCEADLKERWRQRRKSRRHKKIRGGN